MVTKVVYNIEIENFQPAEKIIPKKTREFFPSQKYLKGLISSFFYKLRKNAFGIFPICSDGFGSRYACINSGAPHFN